MAKINDPASQNSATVRTTLKITDLPCEIIGCVLRELSNIHDLPNMLLACRYFYNAYKEYPGMAVDIITSNVDVAIVPYWVAVYEASRSSNDASRSKQLLHTLCNNPHVLRNKLRHMECSAVLQMSQFHVMVKTLIYDFACCAMDNLEVLTPPSPYTDKDLHDHIFNVKFDNSSLPESDQSDYRLGRTFDDAEELSLSSSEEFRFYRAFYRVTLFLHLFCGEEDTRDPGQQIRDSTSLFFSRHSPWANEQLWCILVHLRDSRTTGRATVQAMYDSSDTQLQKLLQPLLDVCDNQRFEDALILSTKQQWATITPESSDEDLKALEPEIDTQDTDSGPFRNWKSVSTSDTTPLPLVAFRWNDLNRHSAYVFWDSARIDRHDMLRICRTNFEIGIV
ncbi:hypothetical protein GGR57DRAFT_513825 [Xylariaceae sp. FL1272]|nr:hypothetical protein GGR57DRAFT_513825 [Xylariaceae sp. FL1272]